MKNKVTQIMIDADNPQNTKIKEQFQTVSPNERRSKEIAAYQKSLQNGIAIKAFNKEIKELIKEHKQEIKKERKRYGIWSN